MRKFLFCILLNLLSFSAYSLESSGGVLAYKDWKAEKVQVVQNRMSQVRAQLDSFKALKHENLAKRQEQELSQVQWNLDVARDLSITDYVALYLASQKSKTRFQEAAAKLTPSEVVELLEAYSSSLGTNSNQSLLELSSPDDLPFKSGSTALLSK